MSFTVKELLNEALKISRAGFNDYGIGKRKYISDDGSMIIHRDRYHDHVISHFKPDEKKAYKVTVHKTEADAKKEIESHLGNVFKPLKRTLG